MFDHDGSFGIAVLFVIGLHVAFIFVICLLIVLICGFFINKTDKPKKKQLPLKISIIVVSGLVILLMSPYIIDNFFK